MTRLLDDETLERSPVVANCTMNRERSLTGSNGYGRELGLDVTAELSARAPARWLDLCCGSGRALYEAAALLGDRAEIVGVDLAGHFAAPPGPSGPRLVTAALTGTETGWAPEGHFDLITSVHGLHYVGDKLGVLARAASWLTGDGLLVASFDARSVRWADGAAAGRRLTAELRRQGFDYDPSRRRVSLRGRRDVRLPYRYLGADDRAGPNYTGQPAVDSFYDR
ncbi:class I SAM-dependent methyltransferase [Actinomadura viridis]|uniref:SAM-dependent methyltransferase n=1 Tax=Actinomadura viridis TaxID=58110 RepID=A0A931DFD2_9ACTN|nr:methyltransferase domain-containing protein [Actinomadura viridis]MBG6087282.1 SAM-dependent methyltransferase [Actinomadura viridis]